MAKLKYKNFPALDAERHDFVRRTRTVCVHSKDRPKGIYSKSIVRVVVRCENIIDPIQGVFCVDSLDSQTKHLVGHKAHFKDIPEGSEIDVEIFKATPQDCVEWLRGNDDPNARFWEKFSTWPLKELKKPSVFRKSRKKISTLQNVTD
jgi:hypothetical protein